MFEKGKIDKLLSRTIERGITVVGWLSVSFIFVCFFFPRYLSMTVAPTYLLIVYGSLLPWCLYELRKTPKKSKRLIAWLMLVMFYGVIPCWIWRTKWSLQRRRIVHRNIGIL